MKKIFIKVVLVLSLVEGLGAEEVEKLSGLEILWNYAVLNNYELLSAEQNVKNADTNYKNYLISRIPEVSFSTASSFDSLFQKETELSEEIEGTISVTEEFDNRWGLQFSTDLVFSDESSEDSAEKNNYLDSVDFDINFYQYLYPMWKNRFKNCSEKRKLLLEKRQAECSQQKEIFDYCKSIADLFIEYRGICRSLSYLKSYLFFLDAKKKSYTELQKNGQISLVELINVDEEIFNYNEDYLEYFEEKESVKNELLSEIGFCSGNDNFLEEIDVFGKLPDVENFNSNGLNEEYYILQKEINMINLRSELQQNAPLLKAGLTIPGFQKESDSLFDLLVDNKKWSVSFSVDLNSSVFTNKKTEKKYLEMDKLFNKKIESIKRYDNQERKIYSEKKVEIAEVLDSYVKLSEKNQKKLLEIEQILNQGDISYLDFAELKVSNEYLKAKIENLKDKIWFCDWMIKE